MPSEPDGPGGAPTLRAPAKVNLFLEVLGRRPDGYHAVETLMLAVSLCDDLEFRDDPAGAVRLTCTDPALGIGPDNLVVRAADLLRQRTGHQGGAAIRLVKRIPWAAGLAGGSSDAATTLAGLNRLWRLGLTRAALAALAAELGSDVPFFLSPPAAWCTGRGEIVSPLRPGKRLHLVLVSPRTGLSTPEVFRGVAVPDQPVSGDAIQSAFAAGDAEAVGRLLFNRLQEPAERLSPEVAEWRRHLTALDPAGCLMSGSGSSLFALGRDRADAVRMAAALRRRGPERSGPRVFLVRSCV